MLSDNTLPQKLKKYLTLFVSLVAVIVPIRFSQGCAGGGMEPPDFYALFNEQIIDSAEYHPNYFTEIFSEFTPQEDEDAKANIEEWKTYFPANIITDDISELIYKTSINDVKIVAESITSSSTKFTSPFLQKNTAIKYVSEKKDKDFIKYLLFALQVQDYAANGFWEGTKENENAVSSLMKEGISLYKKNKNTFLKIRYGYQLTRLARISCHFAVSVEIFDKMVEPLKQNSIIRYWALNYKAGALECMGREAEAIYHFSKVFANCPSRRAHSIKDFTQIEGVASASVWDSAIALCKSNDEKIKLWALRGFSTYYINVNYAYVSSIKDWGIYEYFDTAFESIKNIAALNPGSNYLEPLFSIYIRMLENTEMSRTKKWKNKSESEEENYYFSRAVPNADIRDLKKIVNTLKQYTGLARPYFWRYASAYLSYLSNDFSEARSELKKAKELHPKDKYLDRELILLEAVMKADEATSVTPELEDYFFNVLKKTNQTPRVVIDEWTYNYYDRNSVANQGWKYIMDRMADLYNKQGNFEMQELCKPSLNLYQMMDYDTTDMMLKFIQKKDKPAFQTYASSFYPIQVDALHNLEGTILMCKYDFYGALVRFNLVRKWGDDHSDYLPADPFYMRLKDCHDCDYAAIKKENKITKADFCERMMQMEKQKDKQKPNDAATTYFYLANAYYNMTKYGNCWSSFSYAEHPSLALLTDCSKAEEYYGIAKKLTGSREFAAKCCFMAAKCEQNTFYNLFMDYNPWSTEINKDADKEKPRYQTHFKILSSYSNTEFYKQALEECGYLRSYAANK